MKIALVSDLHIEFAPIKLPTTDADILLLAGDIVPIARLADNKTDANSRKVQRYMDHFIQDSLSQYKQVYHILGNHEYYHGNWETSVMELREFWDKRAKQVRVLNKEAVQLRDGLYNSEGGVPALRLWGGTLWTDFEGGNPIFMNAARMGLNDYMMVHTLSKGSVYGPYGPKLLKLKPEDTYIEHENSRYALKKELEQYPEAQWLVMTHHTPSWNSVESKFKDDVISYCFASRMERFIKDHPQIHTWVHGHTHGSHDYAIGKTRVLCNPRGYASPQTPNTPENTEFNSSLVFEI
jgi:Icc-related predicted phosphoesterase